MGIESDQLVYDYLSRVGDLAQQRGLPAATRMRLVTGLRAEIDGQQADSVPGVKRVLARLGTPEAVVAAAGSADDRMPGASWGGPARRPETGSAPGAGPSVPLGPASAQPSEPPRPWTSAARDKLTGLARRGMASAQGKDAPPGKDSRGAVPARATAARKPRRPPGCRRTWPAQTSWATVTRPTGGGSSRRRSGRARACRGSSAGSRSRRCGTGRRATRSR
ncbi:hypothetical protein [Streptomyces angustmyceticus]|uniref:hypothetical protein n=1 Tax=Streptomyces angustmyceticus TaxID=285578 RepID=UPI0021AE4AA5|nr:hypothetical protein [Streptomyces angustmyceticus]